ncbi:hypothetical protein [Dietzia cinnamea]|uniref:hypothetical protein n=1 Tax=Dietzia cinnamea TaxID=321318 RepID=UPI00223AB1DD|nr:hypothetical protein [Dietzia cinnamea]MCT2076062.1 hypothetical protein [Dietzia cinnamea]MCT2219797.1 hypothetical protein [Dietzia cinnamea]
MRQLRQLPEEALAAELEELLRISAEQKASVQGFGSDSVRTNIVTSGQEFDIQVDNVGFNNRVVEVTYTPADSTFPGQGTALYFSMYVLWQDQLNVGQTMIEREAPAPNSSVQKWRVYLVGSDTNPPQWCRLRFYFETIGSGTFTAVTI